ncbi:MAG: ribosome-associated translation inhibitor RaiA [Deltaproteobacteria bacterium]|nr:ribosome-associated translation inhibitor RaiA [Deltaproteobacteria bacterium]
MQVSVTFRHMDSSEALKNYAGQKSERLGKYLVSPAEVHWVLSVEKIRHIAEATIVAKNLSIKAKTSTQEMYSAIDMALDKLEKQVRKHKEKVKNHKAAGAAPAAGDVQAAATGEQKKTPRIVETENLFAKPMSLEEAAMQMEMDERDFLVFTDSATSNINVLYRRGDGDLGLIEARTK